MSKLRRDISPYTLSELSKKCRDQQAIKARTQPTHPQEIKHWNEFHHSEAMFTRVRFPSPAPDPNAKAPDTNQCQGLFVFRLYRVKPGKDRKRPMDFGGDAAGRFLSLTSSASRPAPTGPDRYPGAAAGALRRCAARWRTFPRPTHVPGR